MRIWTIAAKVPDLDAEIAFIRELGGSLVIDDRIPFEGETHRIPLLRWGDKYLHLAQRMVYERRLASPLQPGLCHVVFETDDLEGSRVKALRAGAVDVAAPQRVDAGFGVRDVVFLRSPGGILFELIRVIEDRVPKLP